MKKRLPKLSLKSVLLTLLMLVFAVTSYAQSNIPFQIKNTSTYADNEVYVAIVGIVAGDRHVWVDMSNGQVKDMSPSYNTVAGPVYNGNKGPGQNALYASCFTKLSDIPNKTVSLPAIYGCRMFISVKSQLYFYFFGATGAQVGYTSPSFTDPSDPNTGIKYETIELTYNTGGFWGNTTRVDAYQYPMAMELTATDGSVQKTGELKTHSQIISAYTSSVPTEFQACYNSATTTILFPTKTVAWADGSIGTMPNVGPYVNYMKSYIDQVWAKYANEDLIFSAGDAGVFKGRVSNDRLTLTCISGGFNGRTGIVSRRPTTQEALEGKGVFNQVNGDGTVDLVIQAQLCAALTRHAINVTTANVGQQNWSNPANYYQASPCNYYASFWHRSDISLNSKSYGFAYDDVFEQSSTLHTPTPSKVLVLFGGYASSGVTTNTPPTVSLTAPANNATYVAPATITLSANASDADGSVSKVDFYNGSTLLGSDNSSPYSYTWSGVGAGTYTLTAKATDNSGAVTTSAAITVKVNSVSGVTGLNGNFFLQNRLSGLYMDLSAGNATDGTNIQQWTYNGSTAQQFTLTDLGGGVYKILNTGTSKSLDVAAVSVDNGANVQEWTYNGGGNQKFLITSTGDGYYKLFATHSNKMVEVSAYSTVAGGNIQQWQDDGQLSGQWNLIPVGAANGNGDGLMANYFNGMNFETPVYSQKDASINFNWGSGSPNAAVNSDGFSARWTGQIQPRYSGEYTFYLNTDNGRRLWVNGQLIVDKWIDDWNIEYSGKITLTAGQKYDIKLEYFENYGGASCKMEWSSSLQTREVVPTSQLYSNALPTVSITSPANNASFNAPASITINASASDNGSISKVEFYNGSTKLGEDNSSPYSFTWTNVAAGTYTLTAIAYDNMNAVTVSGAVTVKVNTVTTVNKAPTVSLTSPSSGASFNAPATVSLTATASDADGSVAKVDFYNGSTLLYSDNTSPYSYSWTGVAAGSYTITAKATDNQGAVTTSGAATVTVVAVATDKCSGTAQYVENSGYVAGSKVKNSGRLYECKEWPYSGWCNGAAWAYAPGTGAYWSDAWYDRGSCTARTGEDATSSADQSVLVSPNPTAGVITLHVDQDVNVTVINAQGNEVLSVANVAAEGTIDLSSLASGIYMIKIDNGSEVLTRTIVKN